MERTTRSTGDKFERLVEIMATLRGPNGCPWDKQQDFSSLKPMLVEEVYEVLEAVENGDFDGCIFNRQGIGPDDGGLPGPASAGANRSREPGG